ncbi:hypothetical protein [Streptomyces sp. NPDC004728]|uniref:hypothetical protein n=1 Tax=Streptomyces sp. NPDC004728 TaxID=3154289 RepID=UPI0033AE6436
MAGAIGQQARSIRVPVEALRPGLLRQRLGEAIEGLVDDVRQWNIEFSTELLATAPELRKLQTHPRGALEEYRCFRLFRRGRRARLRTLM